jgi:hypothetical protein
MAGAISVRCGFEAVWVRSEIADRIRRRVSPYPLLDTRIALLNFFLLTSETCLDLTMLTATDPSSLGWLFLFTFGIQLINTPRYVSCYYFDLYFLKPVVVVLTYTFLELALGRESPKRNARRKDLAGPSTLNYPELEGLA